MFNHLNFVTKLIIGFGLSFLAVVSSSAHSRTEPKPKLGLVETHKLVYSLKKKTAKPERLSDLDNRTIERKRDKDTYLTKQVKGRASWYGPGFHGKRTANGEIFNQRALTAASNVHKLGSYLRVTNNDTGKSVIVKVNDTGGFGKYGRVIDLSKGAFNRIGNTKDGIINVEIETLSVGDGKYKRV